MLHCTLSVYDCNVVNGKPIIVNAHKLRQLEVLVLWAEDQPECRWESWAGTPVCVCVSVCVRERRTSMLDVLTKAPAGWTWSYRMMTPTITRKQNSTASSLVKRLRYSLTTHTYTHTR